MSIRKRSLNTTDKKSKSIWHGLLAKNISCLRNLIVLSEKITGRGQLEWDFGSVPGLMALKISRHTHPSVPSNVTPALPQPMEQHRDQSWVLAHAASPGWGTGTASPEGLCCCHAEQFSKAIGPQEHTAGPWKTFSEGPRKPHYGESSKGWRGPQET